MGEPLRDRIREICDRYPECEELIKNPMHSAFTVRGKTFCYYLNDHRGDGRLAMQFRAGMGAQEVLVGADPSRFFRPSYIGHRGWVGLYLDVEPINWEQVEAFVLESYVLVAPKSVSRQAGLNG